MRNEKGFALPVEFSWKLATAGYQWRDTPHGRLLYAVDALQPDWQNTFERYETSYRPLEERTGLFREFAALELSEQRVAAFADRFGLLGSGSHVQLESPYGPVAVHAESFELWKGEIEAFKVALEAWDAVAAARGRALAELKEKFATRSLPLAMRRTLHLDDEDPAMAALSVVQRLADDRLRDRIETRLRFRGSSPRLNVSRVSEQVILLIALKLVRFPVFSLHNREFRRDNGSRWTASSATQSVLFTYNLEITANWRVSWSFCVRCEPEKAVCSRIW
jgi:hypothetical protein